MRRCVFLAVLLSLVLSLSKGSTSEDSTTLSTTTSPTTTGSTSEASTTLSTTTSPTTTGSTSEASTTLSTTTSPTATGSTSEASTTLSTTTSPTATGSTSEASTTLSTTTSPTATGSTSEASTTLSTTTSPTATGSTSEASTTLSTTTSPTATATTPAMGDFCKPNPCGNNSAKCVALKSNFTCQCQYGFYYSKEDCHRGQIFPGIITLNAIYSDSVQIVNSMEYEELFQRLTKFFKDALSSLGGFEQTVIVEIQPHKESRAALTTVTVTNLFTKDANVSNTTVSAAINNATMNSSLVSHYTDTTYCAAFKCDAQTTDCEESMFPKCICKSNFSMTEWDDRSCSDCSKDCSAEENEYCAKEKGVPTCKCMPDFEQKNGKCVSCPVGYSGENCKNNSKLILIIVGTVFGAIILSLVIAVSIVSVRAKHKQDPEKKSLIRSGYSNPNTSDNRQTTMFPRVQTTSGHANPGYQPNNPYEMRSSNRGRFPERDYDDLYEISREPEGFRMQRRY